MLDVRKIRLILELRESGINDPKVLSAIEKIPRENFIPENFRNQAYDNIALPIGENQTISQPFVVAKMTQILNVNNILESNNLNKLFDIPFLMGAWSIDSYAGIGTFAREIERQSMMNGYISAFYLFSLTAVVIMPLLLLIRMPKDKTE